MACINDSSNDSDISAVLGSKIASINTFDPFVNENIFVLFIHKIRRASNEIRRN